MIEKLDKFDSTEASIYHAEKLYAKVNQIVDAVNGILDYAPLEMAMKAEPETPAENVQKDTESRPVNVLQWIRGDDDEVQRYGAVARGFKNLRKKTADPYAEQRKWIGCVCRFWFDNPDDCLLDILGKVQTGEDGIEYYAQECYDWYPHCEPVKPTDSIIYKGGDND